MKKFIFPLVVFIGAAALAETRSEERQGRVIGKIIYPAVNPETGQTNAIVLKIPRSQPNDVLKVQCGLISDVAMPSQITYKYVEVRSKRYSDYCILTLKAGDSEKLYKLLKHSETFRRQSLLLVK